MTPGLGELLLLALLVFILFGPRRKASPRPLLHRSIAAAVAVAAPALLVMDAAGTALALAPATRAWLVAAAAASGAATLLVARAAERWLDRCR